VGLRDQPDKHDSGELVTVRYTATFADHKSVMH